MRLVRIFSHTVTWAISKGVHTECLLLNLKSINLVLETQAGIFLRVPPWPLNTYRATREWFSHFDVLLFIVIDSYLAIYAVLDNALRATFPAGMSPSYPTFFIPGNVYVHLPLENSQDEHPHSKMTCDCHVVFFQTTWITILSKCIIYSVTKKPIYNSSKRLDWKNMDINKKLNKK